MKMRPVAPCLRRSLLSGILPLYAMLAQALTAAPVTPERLEALPEAERPAWRAHLERSEAVAQADAAALQSEVTRIGLAVALAAPGGSDFRAPQKKDAAWYALPETTALAEAVLSFQAPSGGWSKHLGYTKGPRQPGMQWTSQSAPGKRPHYLATFDNGATTEELRFLGALWSATRREDAATAVNRGIRFILDAQYPNGGWPQVFPLEGGYHDNITLNDDAFINILEILDLVSKGAAEFACVDDALRSRSHKALEAGIACLLRMQVKLAGTLTVWCAQHDALTLEPTAARAMEPASLSGMESASVLKFLMTRDSPSPELVASIEAGLAWLAGARVEGLVRRKEGGKTGYFPEPTSTEVYWARFYSLETGRPIFPGRDGVIYASYNEMIAKNEGGYDYYSTRPGSILNNGQKQWRKRLGSR